MKKALAIFITVCIIASLFVSCDNTTMLDELVSTRFDAAGSRSLIVSNENFIGFDDNSIKWQYMAVKVSDEAYNVGASSAWKTIPANGSDEGKLNNTIEFSQGKWNFELRAVKTNNDNSEVVIYYGKTEAPVLLQKQTSTDPQRIVINLTAQLSGQTGYIVLSNVSVKHTSGSNTETYDAPSKVTIDAGTDNEKVLVLDTDYSSTGTAINTIGGGYAIPVGTHTVKVQKIGQNNEILAEEEKTIEVYAGLKTTISNWIIEITQAGKFEPVAPTGTTSGNKASAVDGKLALTVENVTPSMVSGKNTTVTVPTEVLGDKTSATVSVAVKQASEASSDNSFTASSGKVLAAVIDLTLSAESTPVTNFNSPIKVETYVARNLAGFSFGYPEETWTKKESLAEVIVARDYYYDSGEGKLTFLTDHFSSFIVETSSVAVIGDTAYNSLSSAISHVEEGQTITAIKDVSSILSSGITINNGKTFTIDLNGHNYDKRLTIKNSNITIKNGSISGVDQPIVIYSSTVDCQYNSVTIEDDVKIIGTGGFGIVIYPVNGYQVGYGTVLNLNGSIKNVESGVFVLGTIKNNIEESKYPVTVNIGPTAKITSLAGGIHENGTALITVEEGAEFDCVDTAIEVRSGNLIINGGVFNSTADSFSCDANSSGSTTSGAAIAIAQHTTKKDISVVINGGTFRGVKALNESNPQKNDPAPHVKLDVNGGTFIGDVSITDSVKFITGGTFSSKPSADYIVDSYCAVAQDGKWIIQEAPVVIGNKGYATLNDALTETNNGGDTIATIEIKKDITLENAVTIKKSVTIEGNNHSISYTGSGFAFVSDLPESAEVIVNNCVFEKPENTWANTVVGGITYNGCTFNGGCVYVTPSENDRTITIENCTFNGAMLTIDFMNTVKRNTNDPIDGTLNAIIKNNTFNINTPFNINNMHDGVGLVMFIREDSGFYTNVDSKVQITVEGNKFNNQTSEDSYCAYQIIQTWTGSLSEDSVISAISIINNKNTFGAGALYSWANYSPWKGWSKSAN